MIIYPEVKLKVEFQLYTDEEKKKLIEAIEGSNDYTFTGIVEVQVDQEDLNESTETERGYDPD